MKLINSKITIRITAMAMAVAMLLQGTSFAASSLIQDEHYKTNAVQGVTDNGNLPSNVGIKLMKKRKVDITVNVGKSNIYSMAAINNKIDSILKPKLDEEKIDYKISVQQGANTNYKAVNGRVMIDTDGNVWDMISKVKLYDGKDVVSAAYDGGSMYLLKADGTVWASGANRSGQLGMGYTTTNNEPLRQIQGLNDIAEISAGNQYCLARTNSGKVYAWGYNRFWTIGNGDGGTYTSGSKTYEKYVATPYCLASLSDIAQIEASQNTAMAIKKDGTSYFWGYWGTSYYVSGYYYTVSSAYSIPTPGATNVEKIALGGTGATILKRDGSLWAMGGNPYGVHGNGNVNASINAVSSTLLPGKYKDIARNGETAIALKSDGTLWRWGYSGQSIANQMGLPTEISGITGVKKLVSHYSSYVYFLREDNSVYKFYPYLGVLEQFLSDSPPREQEQESISTSAFTAARAGAENFFVHVGSSSLQELSYSAVQADLLQRFLANNINFVGLGSSGNRSQFESLISKNNGYGSFIDYTSLDSAMHQLASYISNKVAVDVNVNVGKTSYDMATIRSKINTIIRPKLAANGIVANINVNNPTKPEDRLFMYDQNAWGNVALWAYDPNTNTSSQLGGMGYKPYTGISMGADGKLYYVPAYKSSNYVFQQPYVYIFDLRTNNAYGGPGTPGTPASLTVDLKNRIYLTVTNNYGSSSTLKYDPKTQLWSSLYNGMYNMQSAPDGAYVVGFGSVTGSGGISYSRIFLNGSAFSYNYPNYLAVNRDSSFIHSWSFLLSTFYVYVPGMGSISPTDGILSNPDASVSGITGGASGKYIYAVNGRVMYDNPSAERGIYEYDYKTNTSTELLDVHGASVITYTTTGLLYYALNGMIWVYDTKTGSNRQTTASMNSNTGIVKYPAFDVYSGTPVSLENVLSGTSFKGSSTSYFVELSDISLPEMDNTAKLQSVASTLKKNNVRFVGLGRAANSAQLNNVIAANDGKGDFYDITNLDTALDSLGEYIVNTSIAKSRALGSYMLVTDEIDPNASYMDMEEDDKEDIWTLTHNPNAFVNSSGSIIPVDNSNGLSSFHGKTLSSMITSFIEYDASGRRIEKVGNYTLGYKAKDKPKGDDARFDSYRKESNTATQPANVVRKPIAEYSSTTTYTSGAQSYTVTLTDNGLSYDPDHSSRSDKGIIKRRWGIAQVDAATGDLQWAYKTTTDNSISYPVEGNVNYLVSLEVQDMDGDNGEGFWSDPNIRIIGHVTGPVAQFEATPNPLPLSSILNVDDTSYVTAPGATITQRVWTITKDEDESFTYLSKPSCKTSFADSGVGTYQITLVVQDSNGMWSDPYTQTVTVVEDLQFTAKLKTDDAKFSLSSIPASENLRVYDAWTKFFYNVRLEMAMYNAAGTTQVTDSKIVEYDPARDVKTGDEITWADIVYGIPETLPDGNYTFRIMAIGEFGQSRTVSFSVTVRTPINLVPALDAEIVSRENHDIKAATSKYANFVQATLYRSTPYQAVTSLPLIDSTVAVKSWLRSYHFSEAIPEGSYTAEFRATTPNGNVEIKTLTYQHINNRPPVVTFSISPAYVYEGDNVTVNMFPTDPDNNLLNVILELKKDAGGWSTIYTRNNVPSGTSLSHVINSISVGGYQLRVTATDPYGMSDTKELSFAANELSITGSVSHTALWEQHRIKYNLSKGGNSSAPRVPSDFFPGERFMLHATTTVINPLSSVKADYVTVTIINTAFNMSLAKTAGFQWEGSLWDNSMIRWDDQLIRFLFTVRYSNGTIKNDTVEVNIKDDEYWRQHMKF